ncbi:MAG: tyrosine-type recombinase/integrase [Anaerolineae bacterium]|nr:tyrosine-type recombinase/integrase [Anaerolineae bacterium]
MDKQDITLDQAIDGYFIAARARRLSPHTLADYDRTYRAFCAFLESDPLLASITADQIRDFLNEQDHLSAKSLLNFHIGLSALWTWAVKENFVERNIVRDVDPPKPEQTEIVPFTQADVKDLLAACNRTRSYMRSGQRRCDNARPTAQRDRAILLALLDTGMRASELCQLHLYDADLKNHRITVQGKGKKERIVAISPRTANAIWRYLSTRPEARPTAFLFAVHDELPFNRCSLRRLVSRIGERAGVLNVHPHRFRHTFAIAFLRNGGNIYVLQRMLGHSTLSMVNRYLAIAQADIENVHRDASPVTNWCL